MTNGIKTASLSECHHDAVILAGLLDAIDLLDNDNHRGAMTSVVATARKAADQLADNLDALDG